MIRIRIAAAALAALVVCGRAEAQPEAAVAAARSAFELSVSAPWPELKPSVAGTWRAFAQSASRGAGLLMGSVPVVATVAVGATSPAAEIDLASILNRQLKTSLRYSVGGKDVWVGGAFDRQRNAYVSILVDGGAPRFYNVKSLLDQEQSLQLGAARYKMYLAPNVINQMKSEIVLENAADEDDKIRVTLKKMMDAAGAAGQAVTLETHAYRVFYTDDVRSGVADPAAKVFTFLLVDGLGEIHVFIIPAELVPGDKIAVFKMFADKRVGLLQAGGRLKIYENP